MEIFTAKRYFEAAGSRLPLRGCLESDVLPDLGS
jgi:hypothetical protein